jgi:hypothetical protein
VSDYHTEHHQGGTTIVPGTPLRVCCLLSTNNVLIALWADTPEARVIRQIVRPYDFAPVHADKIDAILMGQTVQIGNSDFRLRWVTAGEVL